MEVGGGVAELVWRAGDRSIQDQVCDSLPDSEQSPTASRGAQAEALTGDGDALGMGSACARACSAEYWGNGVGTL